MRPIHSFASFLTIILTLSFAINFYVLARLCSLFGIKKGPLFWVVLLVCTVSLIGAAILHSHLANIISTIVYTIATTWLGVLWLLFCTLLVYELLRLFVKINPPAAGLIILTIVALLCVYSTINARLLRVKTLTIPGNADLRIVHLSDIHIGSVSASFLNRIIDKTNALNPDLVLITGDLLDNLNKTTRKALPCLKKLNAPAFLVTGNHETYIGPARITQLLSACNVTLLDNQSVDYGPARIIGIAHTAGRETLPQVLHDLNTDNSKFSILMYHRPVDLHTLSAAGINLTLSGHTHAGQIFPFNYIIGLFHRPLSGLHNHNGTYIYVTSGTGTWGPRMRLGSRSEIVLLKITRI